jgi:anti-sigma B factor antagonist
MTMPEAATTFEVREAFEGARIIAIKGDITAASEDVLMDAYGRADEPGVRAIVLDFTALDYMNSGGIGLLVTLLVRAQRQRQRVLAFGLSDHYRQIFELTRLDEAVGIHDSEDEALAEVKR